MDVDLSVVAGRLGLKPGTGLEALASEVRNRLEADGERCLIVFDNVADLDGLRPYVPAAGFAYQAAGRLDDAIPL